ncbi:MAG: ABC transporter permease [Bacteroidota bacterium]|nr:ABC transporter permease [Bacteroidota bacterium]
MRFAIELWEGLVLALFSLISHKMRAVLTMLGIIIGIVTVTAMFTVIRGLEGEIDRSLSMLGTNVLFVERTAWFYPPQDWIRYASRPDIRADLADEIRDRARYVTAAAPIVDTGRPVRYRDRAIYGAYIQGSTPDITRVDRIDLTEGRWYNEIDNLVGRNVAVIGSEIAETLFPNEQTLGKAIRIGGRRFEVIGVLAKQGKFFGLFSFDEQIQIPLSTFERHFGRYRSVTIKIRAASADVLDRAEEEITGIVRAERGLDAMEENNFEVNKTQAFRDQIANVKAIVYGIGLFLTGLSLLVGGIGVMNIMFVAVRERTREIGIRKAVGAKRRAILVQFLIEAITVCVAAGVLGVLASTGVTALINQFIPATLSMGTIMLAFFICVGVGIIFGVVPAWNAARMKPIDALRFS